MLLLLVAYIYRDAEFYWVPGLIGVVAGLSFLGNLNNGIQDAIPVSFSVADRAKLRLHQLHETLEGFGETTDKELRKPSGKRIRRLLKKLDDLRASEPDKSEDDPAQNLYQGDYVEFSEDLWELIVRLNGLVKSPELDFELKEVDLAPLSQLVKEMDATTLNYTSEQKSSLKGFTNWLEQKGVPSDPDLYISKEKLKNAFKDLWQALGRTGQGFVWLGIYTVLYFIIVPMSPLVLDDTTLYGVYAGILGILILVLFQRRT